MMQCTRDLRDRADGSSEQGVPSKKIKEYLSSIYVVDPEFLHEPDFGETWREKKDHGTPTQ